MSACPIRAKIMPLVLTTSMGTSVNVTMDSEVNFISHKDDKAKMIRMEMVKSTECTLAAAAWSVEWGAF